MSGSLVKIGYSRKKALGITSPFYHSYLEIRYKGKVTKMGYYAKNDLLWSLSLVIPVPGELRSEPLGAEYSLIISNDDKKIKNLLKIIREKRFAWKLYLAFFRNCFHWRNAVLEAAAIKYPKKDWSH